MMVIMMTTVKNDDDTLFAVPINSPAEACKYVLQENAF